MRTDPTLLDAPDPERLLQPRLRGVLHQQMVAAFFAAGVVLVVLSHTVAGRLAMATYTVGLTVCLGTSALLHRGHWTVRTKARLNNADHAGIFVVIAATFTPVCVVLLPSGVGRPLLVAVWAGALGGIALTFLWKSRPTVVEVAPYIALGWLGVLALPSLLQSGSVGGGAVALLAVGGGLYTLGALTYAVHWPNPFPRTFGYHEIFHAMVIAAAAVQMVFMFVWVMPLA